MVFISRAQEAAWLVKALGDGSPVLPKILFPVTMDAITTAILAALAKLAEPAIKDAYDGLKAIIIRKFGAHHEVIKAVDSVEKNPDSLGRRETLKEEVVASGAATDAEILAAARSLLEELKQQPGGQETVHQIVTGNRNIFSGSGDIHIGGTPP